MGRLGAAVQIGKREVFEILPVVIFFVVSFNLIAFSKHLILQRQGIVYDGIVAATLGAVIVAKVVIIADRLPIMRLYRGRPLYRAILYRTIIYTVAVLAVRGLDVVVRSAIEQGSLTTGLRTIRTEFVWEHFVFVQMWVLVLFLVYVALVELRHEFGRGELAKLLFSRRAP